MKDLFYDPQLSLGFMTITANRLLCAVMRRKMLEAGIDLTAEQWGVLVTVWNHGGISQDKMARIGCVDKSSMSRVLAVMERRGLVVRRPDPADARRKTIFATEQANALRERSRAVVLDVFALALRDVSPQDHAVCLNVLDTVKRTLMALGR